jgi:hypothetical protein
MLLAWVLAQVVELYVIIFEIFQQLPIPGTHGTNGCGREVIVRVMKEEGVTVEMGLRLFEQRDQAQAVEWGRGRRSAKGIDTTEIKDGRQEVGANDWLVAASAGRR